MTYTAPSLSGETTIVTGRSYAVEDYHALQPGLGIILRTGNGDDGLGVTFWWSQPLEFQLFANLGIQVEGLKVSGEAEILGLDGIGTPIDSSGQLLNSTQYTLIPDLFDSSLGRVADIVFTVTTGAPAPDETFLVIKAPEPPDQVFTVTRGPDIPDAIYGVQAITSYQVDTAEPPFIVTVFAKVPNEIFTVTKGPAPPDTVFLVSRGPSIPDTEFTVNIISVLNVTTSWPSPDIVLTVTTGPNPPPIPDEIFGVSVGGPDAPPIPEPDQILAVRVGAEIPTQVLSVRVQEAPFTVMVAEPAFVVTVGPEVPYEIFAVTAGAYPANDVFMVTIGADVPDETLEVLTITTHQVMVADAPLLYSVSTNGSDSYSFTGSGLAAATNPGLTATVGQLLTFNINATGHPFWIKNQQVTGNGEIAPSWALEMLNNGTQLGNLRVIFAEPGNYFYVCAIHGSMTGTITVV